MPDLTWRPMRGNDVDAVVALAAVGFPDHFEDRGCFENRLALHPRGCFVLAGAEMTPCGYAVSYPWAADAAPALNTRIDAIPDDATVLYLHDLVVHPEARGAGHSRTIVGHLMDQARAEGLSTIALIAVNAAVGFWQGHGFAVRQDETMTRKLASYGPDARYMIRKTGQGAPAGGS